MTDKACNEDEGRVWAVVPLKMRGLAKQRLSCALAPDDRSSLMEAMAKDVIETLTGCSDLAGVIVVTRDEFGEELRSTFGVTLLKEPENSGLNGAVRFAGEFLERKGVASMLVVPGDVPLLAGDDLAQILAHHNGEEGLTLVPAWGEGGTNCFLVSPPRLVEPQFGEDSFRVHARAAREKGRPVRVLTSPHVGLDIDRPADLGTLQRMASFARNGSRTFAFLSQMQNQISGTEPEPVALQTGELA